MWHLSYTPGIIFLFLVSIVRELTYGQAIPYGASPNDCDSLRDKQGMEASSWTGLQSVINETACNDDSEVTIAVMGATGTGKTSFINMASGSDLHVGESLQSCTNIVQVARPFVLGGRCVTLIDSPGFDDTTKSDSDILRMVSAFLAAAYEKGKKLAGVVYMHRISDFKMGGISTRNLKMFQELCGESTLKNVIIVTNMWGEVSQGVGEAREQELVTNDLFFKPVLEKGALMLRHNNTPESALFILEHLVHNQPLSLQIQRELVDEKKDISETAAGEQLNKELNLQARKHQEEMTILEKEMKETIDRKDKETRHRFEIEAKKLQAQIDRVQDENQRFSRCDERMRQRKLALANAGIRFFI